MNHHFEDVHRDIQDLARRFSRERLAPRYMERERIETVVDRDLLRQMGSLGLIAPEIPEELGGLGLTPVASGIIAEEVGYGDFNIGYLPVLGALMASVLAQFARPAVARTWVPRITGGDAIIAIALTEPRGGSDAANLILSARRCEGGYRLNGEKTSISLADQADGFVVFARTGDAKSRAKGVSAFMVPADSAGISRTRFDDLGSHVLGRGSIFFDDVFIPEDHLLGEEGGGFVQIMEGFDYSRALLGLLCIGAAQASLDESWAYIEQREAFGQKLSAFQGVTFPLAEGETAMEAARQLCLHTLRLKAEGHPHTAEAAMCKWLGPKASVDVIHQCLLTHGHYGWSKDMPHQQRLRDVMGIEIGDGTAQIMKMIIARTRAGPMR